MSQESTTPDLVELTRRRYEAFNLHDFDAVMSFFAPGAVLESGIPRFVGADAIRAFEEDFWRSYEEYQAAPEEIVQVGAVIVLVIATFTARLHGSSEALRTRSGHVFEFQDGLIVRWAAYQNIDEARAAAERLTKERG